MCLARTKWNFISFYSQEKLLFLNNSSKIKRRIKIFDLKFFVLFFFTYAVEKVVPSVVQMKPDRRDKKVMNLATFSQSSLHCLAFEVLAQHI